MGLSYYAFSVEGQFGILSVIAAILFGVAMTFKQFKYADKSLEESNVIKWYVKTMEQVIASKWRKSILLGIGFLTLAISVAMIPLGVLKMTFMPQDEPEKATVRITAPAGSRLEDSKEITKFAEEQLYDIEDIENF